MVKPAIKNLDELLRPILSSNSKIIKYESENLIGQWENYGSLLIALKVTIEKSDKSIEIFNLAAKLCPENNWLKRMFASLITFKKEIGFYTQIIPELIKFQKENNVPDNKILDIYPKCINGRLSLDPKSDTADDDAILLLENLKFSDFKMSNRLKGMNFEESVIVLQSLAHFHGVPLAYKLKKPKEFQTKIMPLLNRILIGQELQDLYPEKFIEVVYRNIQISEANKQKLINGMMKGFAFLKNFPPGKEEYATIVHGDFWINNTMLKFENNKPVSNKMLDFQVNSYGNLTTDLLFFLFTSIDQTVLEKHYSDFLKIYHNEFVQCLQNLNCNITNYTYDSFLNEVNYYGPLEACHILFMFKAVYSVLDDSKKKKIEDLNVDDMFTDDNITDIYKNKTFYTVNKFLEFNWL